MGQSGSSSQQSLKQKFHHQRSRIATKLQLDWRTFISGVLIVLAFPPHDFTFTIWFALVPWLLALRDAKTLKRSAIQGVWLSFWMSSLGFFWCAYAIHQFGGLPWAVAVPLFLFGCFFGQPQFILFGVLHFVLKRFRTVQAGPQTNLLWIFTIAFLYTGVDSMIPHLFMDTLGHAFFDSMWIVQIAELGGAPMLTFLILLHNEALAEFVRAKFRAPLGQREWSRYLIPFAICLLAVIWGGVKYNEIQQKTDNPSKVFKAGVVQANIGDFEKVASETGVTNAADTIVRRYLELSKVTIEREPEIDFVVWPETAYPHTFRNSKHTNQLARQRRIENFVKNSKVPLFFGAYDTNGKQDFNSLFYLTPKKYDDVERDGDLQVFHKHILLPFGEYVPFLDGFKFVEKLFPQMGFFGRGVGPVLIDTHLDTDRHQSVKTVPAICYEILDDDFIGRGVYNNGKDDADIILNVTNDSWFGPYGEPDLHLALSAFRAVETRRSIIRSTNTGYTTLILPTGEITDVTGLYARETKNYDVPVIERDTTLFLKWGDWFGRTAFLLGIALMLVPMTSSKRRR